MFNFVWTIIARFGLSLAFLKHHVQPSVFCHFCMLTCSLWKSKSNRLDIRIETICLVTAQQLPANIIFGITRTIAMQSSIDDLDGKIKYIWKLMIWNGKIKLIKYWQQSKIPVCGKYQHYACSSSFVSIISITFFICFIVSQFCNTNRNGR